MHRYNNSPAKPVSPPEESPEATDLDGFMICRNPQCAHYDQHDPGGNNCTLLFVLSEEGCENYGHKAI